ncbi:hypothetical protein [Agrococcus sp. DT81.2]|uniref:hypothetical protein n=1 Tax=Agrococcus sp. DT81.2 TaxID=3393414 RepID=UPI003CE54362
MDNDNEDRAARAEKREVDDLLARATPCDVAGCDGIWHDSADDPAEWTHRVRAIKLPALGGGCDLYIDGDGRAHIGYTLQSDGDLDAAAARAMAAKLEACAEQLRDLAAEVERRSA